MPNEPAATARKAVQISSPETLGPTDSIWVKFTFGSAAFSAVSMAVTSAGSATSASPWAWIRT